MLTKAFGFHTFLEHKSETVGHCIYQFFTDTFYLICTEPQVSPVSYTTAFQPGPSRRSALCFRGFPASAHLILIQLIDFAITAVIQIRCVKEGKPLKHAGQHTVQTKVGKLCSTVEQYQASLLRLYIGPWTRRSY